MFEDENERIFQIESPSNQNTITKEQTTIEVTNRLQ
jgi:hypothetical protein